MITTTNHKLKGFMELQREIECALTETPVYIVDVQVQAYLDKLHRLIAEAREYAAWFTSHIDFQRTLNKLRWKINHTKEQRAVAMVKTKKASRALRPMKTA